MSRSQDIVLTLFSLLTVSYVAAKQKYVSRIPNGNIIPNPCDGGTWAAVGHMTSSGSDGDLSAFGKDFADAGDSWTKEFCRKDSDGDGKTNGEELGDPDCVWSEGKTPSRTQAITNPAVCDPWGQEPCGVNSTCVAKAGAWSPVHSTSLPALITSGILTNFIYYCL